jgi:tRNA pseudouridine38-40 synthase
VRFDQTQIMRNIRLLLEYDGTDYVGWQRQATGPSIQAELEAALLRLTGAATSTRAAGRTDAGVHARGQVVTFQTASALPIHAFLRGLNAHLPQAIGVLDAQEAPPDFDARHSASGKMYRYQIWNSASRSPLRARTHWQVVRPLCLPAMAEAAAILVGRHDFRAFRAADCERKTTVRLITRLSVTSPEPAVVHIEVEATAFLKNMVRILSGTLVEVGKGKLTPAQVAALLQSGRRQDAGPTAPAHGLLLCRVDYHERTGV